MYNSQMRLLPVVAFLLVPVAVAGESPTIMIAVSPPATRKLAPDFALLDAAGRARSLGDYRGRVVVLDFWATDCGGCRTEIPWFIDLAREYPKRRVAVVGVSMDILYEDLKSAGEAWARVRPFAEKMKMNYPILMGDDHVASAYSIQALPQTWLIDRQGRVAGTYVGLVNVENLKSAIATLLAE